VAVPPWRGGGAVMSSNTESAATRSNSRQFDRTAVRVNQAAMVGLLLIAFLFNLTWLVLFMAAVLAVGTFDRRLALFQRIYQDVIRPSGLLKPDVRTEDAAPHRFAQGVGAAVLIAAGAALLVGLATVGWALALLVVTLAAINLVFDFCAGCFLYLQLSRARRGG
jgi:hypothetical protein